MFGHAIEWYVEAFRGVEADSQGGSACVEDDTVITRTPPPDCDAFFLRSGRSVVVRMKGSRWLRALIARMRDGGGI